MDYRADRRIYVANFHLSDRGENIFRELSVYYDEGGVNYFSYKKKERGYYLSSSIVKVERGIKTWTMGQRGDGYMLLRPAKRFNRRTLDELAATVRKNAERINAVWETPQEVYDPVLMIKALALDDAAGVIAAKDAPHAQA
jgi:hypothetical protein